MCRHCDWERLLDQIQDLIDDEDGRYEFASDTLHGIYDTILRMEHCTERQREAIENIETSLDRSG